MTRIFISYRRDDTSGYAGRLYHDVAAHFGDDTVFMDIDTLKPGDDFAEAIEQTLSSCDTVLVLIGREWPSITDSTGQRRLEQAGDFVRLEVVAALHRNIRVIPVLVQGASMPRADQLPGALARLVRRNAFEISDRRWEYDVGQLLAALEGAARDDDVLPGEQPTGTPPDAARRRHQGRASGGLVARLWHVPSPLKWVGVVLGGIATILVAITLLDPSLNNLGVRGASTPYRTIDLSSYTNAHWSYVGLQPGREVVRQGKPFDIADAPLESFTTDISHTEQVGKPQYLRSEVAIPRAHEVYLLMSLGNGRTEFVGRPIGRVILEFASTGRHETVLVAGDHLRDWCVSSSDAIGRTTNPLTREAYRETSDECSQAVFDMLTVPVPAAHRDDTLLVIYIEDTSRDTVRDEDPQLGIHGITVKTG